MCDFILKVGMQVDYDGNKDEINCKKHGYSLSCAQDVVDAILFIGSGRQIFSDGFERNGEIRYNILAEYNGDLVLIAFTMRGDVMRVISFRTASKEESVEFYG